MDPPRPASQETGPAKEATAVGCDGQEGQMHIEPGLVDGAKIALSYATAAAAG